MVFFFQFLLLLNIIQFETGSCYGSGGVIVPRAGRHLSGKLSTSEWVKTGGGNQPSSVDSGIGSPRSLQGALYSPKVRGGGETIYRRVHCTTDLDTLYYRFRYTVPQAQIHCTTGSDTLYYRVRYTELQAQINCTTGSDTLYYRFRYTEVQAQINCTTGLDKLNYRLRYTVLQVQIH